MDTKFGLMDLQKKLLSSRRETFVLLSNQAEKYFLSSFKKQSWDGKEWKNVKRRIEGTKSYKYPKSKGLQRRTSPILVGAGFKIRGGTLRRAVSTMSRTANIGNSTLRMIVDVPYAAFHNEGTEKLPQRRFIGQTNELTEMQRTLLTKTIDRIFKLK